jgi:hypothetical protein
MLAHYAEIDDAEPFAERSLLPLNEALRAAHP